MAKNSIEAVRDAETKADEVTRNAAQQGATIVDEANNEAVRLQNSAEDAARDKAAKEIANAHEASKKALEDYMQALGSEMQALTDTARKNQPEAVKKVLSMLTS